MFEKGTYIPSLDAKDIIISNNIIGSDNKVGYNLRNSAGKLNLLKFINTLDYSLDSCKLREIYQKVYKKNEFYFRYNNKNYSQHVINVTFKYSVKLFNKTWDNTYVRYGYLAENLDFVDGIALDENGELLGVKVEIPIQTPVSQVVLGDYFTYKDGMYEPRTIPTVKTVAEIREEVYVNGFMCDGIKYVRFKRSAGASRTGKCLFINEKLYPLIHEWEMCGIDIAEGQEVDLAALEPYIALTLSSIIGTISIRADNILVVDDYKSVFKDNAIATRFEDGRLVSKPEYVEISNSIWDGQSLMDRSIFLDFQTEHRIFHPEARENGMLLLRGRFFKSCCFNTNLQQWFADNGIEDVSQLNGITRATKIEDIKLITTPSSIKYLKFGTLDDWLDNLEPTFGVVKYEKPTYLFDGRMVPVHYQLLNTLDMSEDEVKEFIAPSLEYIKKIRTDPAFLRYQIKYQYYDESDSKYEQGISSKNDIVYRMLSINDKFTNTKIYRDFCKDLTTSMIKGLRCGHVLVRGNYSTICGNPIEMLKQAIGTFDGTSIIEPETIHNTSFANNEDILGSRSPHVTYGNILLTKNILRSEIDKYMNSTPEIVYVNSINENLLERLSGADFDSDTVLLTNNSLLIKAAKRHYSEFLVPTKLVKSTKRKRSYTNEDKADLDIKTAVNKIGEIINASAELNIILMERIHKGEKVEDLMDLYCDIAQLDVMSNLEIDSAKKENPANNIYELQCIKKKYDIRDDKGRHVRPLFFKYIDGYKGYRKGYYAYLKQDDEYVKQGSMLTYSEVKKLRQSNPELVIERGRMSYRHYHATMDYLETCLNRFHDSSNKKPMIPFSEILTDESELEGDLSYYSVNQIVKKLQEARQEIKSIWSSKSRMSNFEKRLCADNIKQDCVDYVSEKDLSLATMRHLLRLIDKKKYKDIARMLFGILFESTSPVIQSKFYELINVSREPVYELIEDPEGDYSIYDFKYRKVVCSTDTQDKYYDFSNQETFAYDVDKFVDKFGIKLKWLAGQIGINYDNLTKFIGNRYTLSRRDCFKLFNFINEYEKRMAGFIN